MKGIMFKEELFSQVVFGEKTQTRRMRSVYTFGEELYLKEPYRINNKGEVEYKHMNLQTDSSIRWNSKMFMPARYARYFIKITDVRHELLQEISHDDCLREGVRVRSVPIDYPVCAHINRNARKNLYCCLGDDIDYNTPQEAYAALIDRINGKGTWDSNPLVTVYDFVKIEKP
ncbi:MAG: hypothetical protein LBG17_04580 [Bacteroidales bacterium]|jgi:hypothetical protein|nr:hypothetical protein [Bacteroidales bacterium]